MNRRRSILASAAAIAFAPVLAQTTREPLRIGWLGASSREVSLPFIAAFKTAMQAMGRKDGEHYVLVERWADNQLGMVARLLDRPD